MSEHGFYEIQVQEALDEKWSAWFDGLTLIQGENNTILLRGLVDGQAALHGLLEKTRDLGLTLISVRRIGSVQQLTPPDQLI